MSRTILIMAGGTGGHIFPGLAVADVMKRRGWRVVWMGNPDGMEAQLVPLYNYPMAPLRFSGVRGKGVIRKLALPFSLFSACRQASGELRRFRPNVVLGMGGYASFPGGTMALLRGCPLVIHEQNAIPGLANSVLAKFATRVVSGFPKVFPKKGEWVGNPIRADIARIEAPEKRYAERDSKLRLLVLGGSLGAAAINEVVPKGIGLLAEEERPLIVHQSGEKHLEKLKENYADAGVKATCVAFIDDMAGAYEWADLVLCRAGALTIAELAAAGVASILVPLPQAVDDHQTLNAKFLSVTGGAVLLPQEKMQPESIRLIRNYTRSQLAQMAEKANLQAMPNAAERVADICEECAR
ncbi:MAG: undecaprenyldiphospho-muramoylpentapeptide beta-N-acetylglucosaminyltransferase [Candidatus Accumulibacter sp.]|jgi:UDP-N-acetylglucosamine--N-acetylmuramyl-(pentapeptide) pyrophosphoryl-undecaprenol N-acetylglucosamine transferase|nr:undecaprenyldiphospho-muramoylpentapeptide beta-N-acetylglucosaminyltransferase [Accumulibacter sp.]